MLPLQNRLPLKTEFARLKKEGKLFSGRFFSIIVAPKKPLAVSHFPRFGFIVSKKIDKRSTKRNRAKRILQEGVARLLPKVKGNLDVVILARKTILNSTFSQISSELATLFGKAKLVENNEGNRSLAD